MSKDEYLAHHGSLNSGRYLAGVNVRSILKFGALKLAGMGLQVGNAIVTLKYTHQNAMDNYRVSKYAYAEISHWHVKPKS